MKRTALAGVQKLSLDKARLAYSAGDFEDCLDWLGLVPAAMRPPDLVSAARLSLARIAADQQQWAEAEHQMSRAVAAAPSNGQFQQRLGLLRRRQPLMEDHAWKTVTEAIDPAARLRPDSMMPEVSAVWACGAYYSRGGGRAAPWSRYLGMSKNPDPDVAERAAVLRLAGDCFCRFIAEETDLLAVSDVVVPIPADPDRYVRRMASLPDELAKAAEAQLAVPTALFALQNAGTGIEMKQLSRPERAAAAAGAFSPGPDRRVVAGRGVLLVDDLITSGSTLRAAASLLREMGAKTVVAAALGHTEG